MDYQVTLSRLALRDLEAIRKFIARDNPPAADAFIRKLLGAAQSLNRFPERGGNIEGHPGVRFLILDPYLLVYRVLQDSHKVKVLRFWHGAREKF